MNRPSKREPRLLEPFSQGGWWLRVYSYAATERSGQSQARDIARLPELVEDLEASGLSPEFEYARVGFAHVHCGRRGTTVSIWHFGEWTDTAEAFHRGWYRYLDSSRFEVLDDREPLLCFHEAACIRHELKVFEAVSTGDAERWIQSYKDASAFS